MKYDESVRNVNKDGMQSVVLELKPEIQQFLNFLQDNGMIYEPHEPNTQSKIESILGILAGTCCEGDYIVTSDETEEYDFQAFAKVVAEHEIVIHPMKLKALYDKLKPFLSKRTLTWG